MSELIAAKAKGDLLDRYKEGKPEEDDDKTESEFVRELLDEGLRVRQEPLYVRLGLPNRHAARLEDFREAGEDEEDAVRRALRDAIESWDDDVLDTLGASDELRERVEAAREEGEPSEDALRRLIRQGIEAQERDLFDAIGAGEELKGRIMERSEDDEEPDDTVRRLLLEGTRRTSPVQESTRRAGGSAVALVLFAVVFSSLPSTVLQTNLLGLTTLNTLTTGVGGVLSLAWIFFMTQLFWRAVKGRLTE